MVKFVSPTRGMEHDPAALLAIEQPTPGHWTVSLFWDGQKALHLESDVATGPDLPPLLAALGERISKREEVNWE